MCDDRRPVDDDRNCPQEVIVKRTAGIAWLGLILIATGMLPALWAAAELTGGVLDMPRHWWSTLATVPFVVGVAITAIGVARLNR